MAYSTERDVALAEHEQANNDVLSPTSNIGIRSLLAGILKMLEPNIREVSIELKNGETVSINEDWEPPARKRAALVEKDEVRQLRHARVKDMIKTLSAEEKVSLLSVCMEEVGGFLEQSDNLETLQSIQYGFTHRINSLKAQDKKRKPRRPVIEQRKVGNYLYKLQSVQRGGNYWYLQFTENGKRAFVYLGKERPAFVPEVDLAKRRRAKSKALSAHS